MYKLNDNIRIVMVQLCPDTYGIMGIMGLMVEMKIMGRWELRELWE